MPGCFHGYTFLFSKGNDEQRHGHYPSSVVYLGCTRLTSINLHRAGEPRHRTCRCRITDLFMLLKPVLQKRSRQAQPTVTGKAAREQTVHTAHPARCPSPDRSGNPAVLVSDQTLDRSDPCAGCSQMQMPRRKRLLVWMCCAQLKK